MNLARLGILMIALTTAAIPLRAEWKALPANEDVQIANKLMVATPADGWNRSAARPSARSERWTRDGLALNELT